MSRWRGIPPWGKCARVVKVDDITGQPLEGTVAVEPIAGGLRLKNIEAARIPGPIGKRSSRPFKLPIYRISPQN